MKNRLVHFVMAWMMAACAPVFTATTATPVPGPTQPSETTSTPPTPDLANETLEPAVDELCPFPQHVSYASGSILPNHRSQAQLDDDARAFYDYWKENYLIEAGQTPDGRPLYRVAFGKEAPNRDETVSEGQGYGMMITPYMAGYDPDARVIFDGLWDFARAHPSEKDARLMDWKVPERTSGNDSAFDGDADIAYSLLLADAQWGSQGRINYIDEAQTLIHAILESTIGPESRMPMLGDWTDPNGTGYNQYTPRSSDFILASFRAYAKSTGQAAWDEVIVKSQGAMLAIQDNYSTETGLIPDFIVMRGPDRLPEPSPPKFLEGPNDGHYFYNAGRLPWRVGVDALLSGDRTSRAIAQKISLWAEKSTGGIPANFRAGYDLQGNPLPGSNYFTSFFVAPLGVAAMSNAAQQGWLNAVYDSVYMQHENYYEDSVTLFCLLIMSGNAWTP